MKFFRGLKSILLVYFLYFSGIGIQDCCLKTVYGSETITIEKIEYKGWKDSYRLSNGIIELIIVPQIGGRIMKFNFIGKENILWENPQLFGTITGPETKTWKNYGGYKLWPAPQKVWRWPPDPILDRGNCEIKMEGNEVYVIGMKSQKSRIRFIRKIKVYLASPVIEITQIMENTSDTDVEWGIWDVTQVKPGGRVLFPVSNPEKIWGNKESLKQSQWKIKDGMAFLNHSGDEGKVFCAGDSGWIAYELEGSVYIKKFEPFAEEKFPEGEANTEVFTGKDYIEVEVVSPLKKLRPGEKYSNKVFWHLFESSSKSTDEELRRFVERKVKVE